MFLEYFYSKYDIWQLFEISLAKVNFTHTSLIVLASPKNRDSGGIHLIGRRALEVRNIMNEKSKKRKRKIT